MKRLLALFTVFVSIFTCAFALDAENELKIKFDSRESYNYEMECPSGKRLYYFAQNSPEWEKLEYNPSRVKRKVFFGGAGCVASAIANLLINTLSDAEIEKLERMSDSTVRIDLNTLIQDKVSPKYSIKLSKADELKRFLPLVLGNIMAGNNNSSLKNPASPYIIKVICQKLDIELMETKDTNKSIEQLKKGYLVLTSSGGKDSPISKMGHFMLMVDIDDEYVYFMDSYVSNGYKLDRKNKIIPIQRGLFAVRIEDLGYLKLNSQYIVKREANINRYLVMEGK